MYNLTFLFSVTPWIENKIPDQNPALYLWGYVCAIYLIKVDYRSY